MNTKAAKLNKARKLLIEGIEVEEVSNNIELSIDIINTLKESMVNNLIQVKEDMDKLRFGVFDALHQDNMLCLEI